LKCNASLFGTRIWWFASDSLGFYLAIISGFWVAFKVTVGSSFYSWLFFHTRLLYFLLSPFKGILLLCFVEGGGCSEGRVRISDLFGC